MRKALITLLAAATVLTPAAALAQRGQRGPAVEDGSGERAERMQRRSEARQQRQEQPQQQEQQAQPQPQPQQQEQQIARNDRRGGGDGNRGGGWRGNDGNRGNDSNRGGGDRNWRGNDGQNDGNRSGRGGDRRGTQQQSIYPQAWQGNPNDPRLRRYQELERRNQQQGYRNDGRRGDRDWRNNDDRRDDRNWRGDRNDRRGWNNNWRNDRRYDWRSWRNQNRNIFRGSRYYSPYRNWGYNRFSIGIFLEPLFYSNRYWIGDPWQYRLPPAYPGTQWVRYYNDVLLVDVYSGEVIDVIYDFFW